MEHQHKGLTLTLAILIITILIGCGPSTTELEAVDYTPLPEGDWQIITPEEQGLDPKLFSKFYYEAEELETLYGLPGTWLSLGKCIWMAGAMKDRESYLKIGLMLPSSVTQKTSSAAVCFPGMAHSEIAATVISGGLPGLVIIILTMLPDMAVTISS